MKKDPLIKMVVTIEIEPILFERGGLISHHEG